MKRAILFAVCLSFTLGFATSARAEYQPFKLLGRGFVNIISSPLEIPKQTIASVKEAQKRTFHVSAAAFAGFVKGIAYMVGRMGSGLWDILTSNFDTNGDPLMKPEYVCQDWPGGTAKAADQPAKTDQ